MAHNTEGPSSDAENETIIATTTYITLSGSHTTESEVFGSASSSSSARKSEQSHRHLSQQDKTSTLYKERAKDISTTIIRDALTEYKTGEIRQNQDEIKNINRNTIEHNTHYKNETENPTEKDIVNGRDDKDKKRKENRNRNRNSSANARAKSIENITDKENQKQSKNENQNENIAQSRSQSKAEIKYENQENVAQTSSVLPNTSSTNLFQPLQENARESACCKVQTIIMDPILEKQGHIILALENVTPTHYQVQSQIHRPSRLRIILEQIRRGITICLQMNKDCIFCLMFFLAFVVCAAFLTIFFYKAMTLYPQTMQYPIPNARIYYL